MHAPRRRPAPAASLAPSAQAWALTALALTPALFLAGCDNSTCVFAGTCQDGENGPGGPTGPVGGLGTLTSTPPDEGDFMTPDAPTVTATFPGLGADELNPAHPETPMFVEFSESLNPESVDGAFELINEFSQVPIPVLTTLTGNGRVAVITPLGPLPDMQAYVLQFTEDQGINDLNGQILQIAEADRGLARVAVDTTNLGAPAVNYAFPADGETALADGVEIVIGFDRPMDSSTVNSSSFVVTVDDVEPVFNVRPSALRNEQVPGGVTRPEVWIWSPFDTAGRLRSYGADARIEVQLSPPTDEILSREGEPVPETVTEFTTQPFAPPALVVRPVGGGPADALGREAVFDPDTVVAEIDLEAPAPSDLDLEIFLFGPSPTNSTAIRSIVRSVAVPAGAEQVTVTSADLNFFDSSSNLQFADGTLSMAVQGRRFGIRSGARLLDGNRDTDELETFVFDTTPPMLLGLGISSADVDVFASDLRDLSIVGRADEEVAFAFVTANAGADDNGGSAAAPPAVAFSGLDEETQEALFIAAAVPLGAVDPGAGTVDFEVLLFDRARNGTLASISGIFEQRGVVGPGGAPTGAAVGVRVFDALTLAPVESAAVFTHGEAAGAVTAVDSAMTDVDGLVSVNGAAAGNTVLTVDAAGYDLFTFSGVPRDRIDVLLTRTTSSPGDAAIEGIVTSDPLTGNFSASSTVVSDSRRPFPGTLAEVSMCGPVLPTETTPARNECSFGPVSVDAGRVGAATFLATGQDLPIVAFNPLVYLRGFALAAPLAQGPSGDQPNVELEAVDQLPLLSPEEQAIAVPQHSLSSAGLTRLGALDGDPIPVTVEASSPGLDGTLAVGRGIAYDLGPDSWIVLSALAGVAGPAGALSARGAIDPDLFLRAELRGASGSVAVARPRLSTSSDVLVPVDAPAILSPAPGGMAPAAGFNLVVADTVPDALGGEAVYRVRLEGPAGRGWVLLALDTDDGAGDILVPVPDVAAGGGVGLAQGTVMATAEVLHGTFDRGEFLYSDLERFYTAYGRAAPITFQVP